MSDSIGKFERLTGIQPLTNNGESPKLKQTGKNDFANLLKSALDHVNKVEQEANVKTEKLATNEIQDLHDVMISAQKASITVETAVQIQQKVIDAYNEMM